MKRIIGVATVFLLLWGCSEERKDFQAAASNQQFLHRSIKQITDRIVYDVFSPPVASRIYAYTAVAAYEAARHADSNFVSLAGQLHGLDPLPEPEASKVYSFPLASIQAVLVVGKALVFSEDKVEAFSQKIMMEYKAIGIPEEVFDNSIDYGNQVAEHILAWAAHDNYKQTRSFPKYSVQRDAASWKPTPPSYMDGIEPNWNKIRTFAIDSANQFMPAPATPFSVDKASQFYKEAMEVYQVVVNVTPMQREIARFWDCNPFVMNVKGHVMFATKKISPGGHWINITQVACTQSNADFVHTAEAYARVAISLADAFISCWDEKYRSRLIRPESYINQYIDEKWVPILQTPPFPEYTSGHSVISTSAATALTALFGDPFAYTDSTEAEFGLAARKFKSFYEASEEAAVSRLYGGIHYRPAIDNGVKEGKTLGIFVLNKIQTRRKQLEPVDK